MTYFGLWFLFTRYPASEIAVAVLDRCAASIFCLQRLNSEQDILMTSSDTAMKMSFDIQGSERKMQNDFVHLISLCFVSTSGWNFPLTDIPTLQYIASYLKN